VCAGKRLVGYYTLAVGAVTHTEAPGRVRRNMPDPVPVMVLGRLAVDKALQGRHIGVGLLRDVVLRTVQAAEIAAFGRSWFTRFPSLQRASMRAMDLSPRQSIRSRP
jgi:predicted N-acetyltransferase YhbS